MNERIRLLAVQAHAKDNTLHYYNPEFIEKFAELIVRECADIAGYYYTRNECVSPRQIKQHFGVEE